MGVSATVNQTPVRRGHNLRHLPVVGSKGEYLAHVNGTRGKELYYYYVGQFGLIVKTKNDSS